MKLALIPPVSMLADIQNREFHLLLPQLFSHPDYDNFYTYMPRKKGTYFILDNGAAEDVPFPIVDLHDLAESVGADEIVLPDIMGDGEATQDILDGLKHKLRDEYKYMYVAHGQSAYEMMMRAAYALQHPRVTTIGIPRCAFDNVFINEYGERLRVKLAEEMQETFMREFDVHLLGSHPLWYQECQLAASSSYVRSMDTSLPYYIAQHGYQMSGQTPQGLKRQLNFFNWKPESSQLDKARWNAELMDRWMKEGNDRLTP